MTTTETETTEIETMMREHRIVLGALHHHKLEKGKSLLLDKPSGREICRRFLQNLPCHTPEGRKKNDATTSDFECQYVHPDPKPLCERWQLYGTCARDNGKKCWYAHESLRTSRRFTIAFHTSTVFGLRLLERCAEIYGAENVTSAARERQESVSGCVVCVSCGDDDSSEKEEANNEAKVIKLIEKMKRNEPHGLSMCSRIYARDERTNEDQVVDFHGDGVEWRRILERVKERWYSNREEEEEENQEGENNGKRMKKKIRTVRIRCFPKEMEIEAYKALDRLIEEAIGDDDVYGLTGPGKGISARECDVALDAMLIRGRLHVSSWRITKELDQSINQALIDAENRRKDIRPLCRAFFKMEEAILRFRLSEFITSASMVVDVGCAPGGWIQALGDEMKRNSETGDDSGIIFAVDPARLGFKPPKTVEPPVNLVHLQKKIEESIDDIHDKLNGKKLSLVACDGNSSPMAVYRWVAPLLSMVDETNGALVLTMKNFVAGKRVFYEASEELAQKLKSEHQFEETHLVPLFSNSTEEMTLVAFRKKRTTTR
ncbi:unnamed protein product [Bathycoccus prasinos]